MRVLRPALIGLSVLLFAGCGSYEAQLTAPGGANGTAGQIEVRDARVAASEDVVGDEAYAAGSDVTLAFTAVNEGDVTDRLVSVSSPVAEDGDLSGDTQIPGGLALVSGDVPSPALGSIRMTAELTDLREPLRAGLTYPVTFVFERGGALTLELPIGNPTELPETTTSAPPVDDATPTATVAPAAPSALPSVSPTTAPVIPFPTADTAVPPAAVGSG